MVKRYKVKEVNRRIHKLCGVWVSQSEGLETITLSQEEFAKLVEPVDEGNERGVGWSAPLSDDEPSLVQSAGGSVMWVATSTRPDLAYAVSHLASVRTKRSLQLANALVRKAKGDAGLALKHEVLTKNRNLDDLQIICLSDSILQTEPGDDGEESELSQQGQVYFLAPSDFNVLKEEGCFVNMIHWRSGRLRRVAGSSLTAETLAAMEAVDMLIYLKHLLFEWKTGLKPKRPVQTSRSEIGFDSPLGDGHPRMPIVVQVHGCESLVNHLRKKCESQSVTEKRLRADFAALREDVRRKIVRGFVWVPRKVMIADELTNSRTSRKIQNVMQSRWLQLREKPSGGVQGKA